MSKRLQGKVVAVVGAGSSDAGMSIGRAIAVLCSREGASVFAISRSTSTETCKMIRDEAGTCEAFHADGTKAADMKAAAAACLERFGRVDGMVNDLGASAPGGPVEMSEEEWDAQVDLNLKSAFVTFKHFLPPMEHQKSGSIVNISSIAGMRYIGLDTIAYSACKAGMIQFSRAVAMKYAKIGIRCNTVVPGFIHTPLAERRMSRQHGGKGDVGKLIAERGALVPMGHMGDAWDIAYATVYLLSDEAKHVTGTEIVVDGGLSARST
jgi:NAD(P)-dependent dehydrogenase (short-subunit alcohol dehydrogenase family)